MHPQIQDAFPEFTVVSSDDNDSAFMTALNQNSSFTKGCIVVYACYAVPGENSSLVGEQTSSYVVYSSAQQMGTRARSTSHINDDSNKPFERYVLRKEGPRVEDRPVLLNSSIPISSLLPTAVSGHSSHAVGVSSGMEVCSAVSCQQLSSIDCCTEVCSLVVPYFYMLDTCF